MHSQPALSDDAGQLSLLQDANRLGAPDGETFDRLTRMACRTFNAAFAAVSMVDRDRQRFRSIAGVHLRGLAANQLRELPLDNAPCAVTAADGEMLVVMDMRLDDRFHDSELVAAGLRFYAGVPLVTRSGDALGAFCIMDDEPRRLSDEDGEALTDMARLVMDQIELNSDPLTLLPSRHQLVHDLEDQERARPGAPMVPVLIDIAAPADFSSALSILGIACVDEVVLSTSRLIRDTLGRRVPLYKVDTTSYLALIDEAGGTSWQEVVTKLAAGLAMPVLSSGVPMLVRAVFGVAPFHLGSVTPNDVIRNVIGAAQDARDQGQQIGVYSVAGDAAMRRRFRLLVDLREALQGTDQLYLAFQPRLDIASGRCVGVEALLRWNHPEFGLVPPGEFIPLVEQTALARPVTEWVIEAALRQLVAWERAGRNLRISVNVSANNLEEADFGRRLADALSRYDVDPARLELELTETALIGNGSRVQRQLEEVKALGVTIAIDDFGTGYSTFSYLMRIPASIVKLDQSFIQRLPLSSRDQTLVRSMISMAHDLGFRVVAEGVETQETLTILGEASCDEAQGYLICRPMAADKLDGWLSQRDAQLAALPQDVGPPGRLAAMPVQ